MVVTTLRTKVRDLAPLVLHLFLLMTIQFVVSIYHIGSGYRDRRAALPKVQPSQQELRRRPEKTSLTSLS
jgi:hypothetical protein